MMSYQWKHPKNRVLPKKGFIPGCPVNAGAKVLGIFSEKCFLPHSQNIRLFKTSFVHFHFESTHRSFGRQKKVGPTKLIADALISSLNIAKGADFPNHLVGAAGAWLALLKWKKKKIHVDSYCTLLLEVQKRIIILNYPAEFTPDCIGSHDDLSTIP